jgi:hypothetical protein
MILVRFNLNRAVGLMKYLVVALTLIFSMSLSVNAADNNTRWILMLSQIGLVGTPHGVHTNIRQAQLNGDYQMGKLAASECYKDLKLHALRRNQTNTFQGENRFRIEIIDDTVLTAKAKLYNIRFELHCVEITLD